jgi:3-deoxy-D-manno-octulosonic-acid transferase
MTRFERFTFLCDENERRAIATLAAHLQRSQSDAIRFVIIGAVQELERLGYLKIDVETPQASNDATPAVSK